MKEMSESDQQGIEATRARRRRIAVCVERVVTLLAGSFWLLLFVVAVRTGYLSWVGTALGALFAGSAAVAPILGWMGRTRLERVFVAVHCGLIVLLPAAALASLSRPQSHGVWQPYRFNDELAALEAKRAVPDAENAALRYDALFARMDEEDEPNFVFNGSSLHDQFGKHPWKGSDYPQAALWLDAQSPTITELLEIGRMEKCRWPVQADMYDGYTVPYRKLNHSVKFLWAAGNRDLGEGHVTKALEKYFCILRVADHLHQQPSLVDSLTGFHCEQSALRMIRHALVQSQLSDEDIAAIADHLPSAADPWPQEWERLREAEKLRYMNLLSRLYEVNNEAVVRFVTNPVISTKDEQEHSNASSWIKFPRLYWRMTMPRDPHALRGMADRYFAKFDPVVRSEHLPPLERDEGLSLGLPGFVKAVCNCHRWWWEMASFNERWYINHRHLGAPSITARRGTWLVLVLRRYHDVHGAWPQTLDAIAAYVPSEAFFDPTAGEAFVYARDGDSFRLYSKGPNRMDDGARSGYVHALDKIEDDIPIWPPPPPKPIPSDEEIRKELEEIYGREYAETYMRDHRSDKR